MTHLLVSLFATILALFGHAPATPVGTINNPPTSGPNGAFLQKNNNLSDVASTTTAANTLLNGLGSATIGSTATATEALAWATGKTAAWYNTADQTTNFEKGRIGWGLNTANNFEIDLAAGGTGSQRQFKITQGGNSSVTMTMNAGSGGMAGLANFSRTTSGSAYATLGGNATPTNSSGSVTAVAGNINGNGQTSTAGYAAVIASTTDSGSSSSGAKYLFQGVNNNSTRFFADNAGNLSLTGSSSSTLVIGATSNNPGCIEMGDSDNSGVTYVTAANGTLTATTTKPSFCL